MKNGQLRTRYKRATLLIFNACKVQHQLYVDNAREIISHVRCINGFEKSNEARRYYSEIAFHQTSCFQRGTRVQISCHQDSPLVVFAEDLAGRPVRIGISEDLNKLLRRTYSAQFSCLLNDRSRLYSEFRVFSRSRATFPGKQR